MKVVLCSLLVPVLAAGLASAATDPGLAGPLTSAVQNTDIAVRGGEVRNTDVYYPAAAGGVDPAAGLCPVVVFGHGFSRNKDRYRDLGRHLASRGFIVLIANYRCGILSGCNHSGNADEMTDVVTWILERNADPGSIFFGRVDGGRIGTSGHSAGGLQGLVAASRDPRVGAAAPLDPVDSNGLGVAELANARIPIAITYSEPSSCNANGSSATLYAAARPQKRGVKLVGANHCDPEQDNDFFGCALTCGAWNATRHQRYVRYVTGWFEYFLHCDPSYKEWAVGPRVQSDLAAGLVTYDADLAPPAPTGLAAAWDGTAVLVSRDPPQRCGGVDAWRVFRSETAGGPYTQVSDDRPVAETAWRDDATAPGRSYRYVARYVFSDFQSTFVGAESNEAGASTPGTTPGRASALMVRRGAGSALEAAYVPAGCATDHVAYWDVASAPAPPSWTAQACGLGADGSATFDPGTPAPGRAFRFVLVGNDGAVEGSYGQGSDGTERAEAGGLPGCDFPRRFGVCP